MVITALLVSLSSTDMTLLYATMHSNGLTYCNFTIDWETLAAFSEYLNLNGTILPIYIFSIFSTLYFTKKLNYLFNFQGLFSRITFAQPVQLGGTSLFLNSEHFLETNKSYQGCIRNLEINNKAYNLNPTDFGGDILSGVDIGKI